MDFRSFPSKYADDFTSFQRDWVKLSDTSKDEIRSTRSLSSIEKRLWGSGSKASFRVGTGEVLTGDVPTAMVVTPMLNKLATDIELVDGQFKGVQGYGSVFDVGYILYDMFGPYTEYMARSAFNKSLALPALQTSFLRSHQGLGLAHTIDLNTLEPSGRMVLGADNYGLGFAASLNPSESDSRDLIEKLQHGSTSSQTSVGGSIDDYQWNDDYTEIEILDWNMSRGEISIVQAGANPAGWVGLLEYSNNVNLQALAEIHSLRLDESAIL